MSTRLSDRGVFRAKTKKTNAWVQGAYHRHLDHTPYCIGEIVKYSDYKHVIIMDGFSDWGMPRGIDAIEIVPETLGECTCVPDKNGKIIFEGDIVKMKSYGRGYHHAIVYFRNGKFAVDGSHYKYKDICSASVEVVGNIHDNPELIRGGDA